MTLEMLHVIRDYTLTRTSIPNHGGVAYLLNYMMCMYGANVVCRSICNSW